MILDTFTKEELISALEEAFEVFKLRVINWAEKNVNFLASRAKGEGYKRQFSGVIKNQRYYLNANYLREGDGINPGINCLFTFVPNGNRLLVVIFNPFADPDATDGAYLKVTTEHFINRYCERHNFPVANKPLEEKMCYFTYGNGASFTGIPIGDFIRRNGKPALKVGFLDASNADMWISCNANGDVAIIEKYGNIPVWRTYISKDMLFEKQKTDPYYQALIEVIRRDEQTKKEAGTI